MAPQTPLAPRGAVRIRASRSGLLAYASWRLVQLVIVLVGVSAVVFFTMHVLPGDVALLLLGDRGTAEQLARLEKQQKANATPSPSAGTSSTPSTSVGQSPSEQATVSANFQPVTEESPDVSSPGLFPPRLSEGPTPTPQTQLVPMDVAQPSPEIPSVQ